MALKLIFKTIFALSFWMQPCMLYSSDVFPKKPLSMVAHGVTQPVTESAARLGSEQSLHVVAGVAQSLVDLEQRLQTAAERIDLLVENQTQLLGQVENLLWLQTFSWAINAGAVVAVVLLAKKCFTRDVVRQ